MLPMFAHNLSHSNQCKVSMVHPPSQLVWETKHFPYISEEDPYGSAVSSGPPPACLISVEPKRQSNEHNQTGANDFRSLIGIL